MKQPIVLSAPLTLSDWALKENTPGFTPAGIHEMLRHCKQYGFTRIYWRCFDAGMHCYASKYADPYHFEALDEENIYNHKPYKGLFKLSDDTLEKAKQIDYGKFDSLKLAIQYGHELGIEVGAWVSINEDDHGGGWTSRYAKAHPQHHWVARDGRVYRSQLSFSFEEVRKYKLQVVEELLAYDIDALFLDWIRTGDVRDNPQADENGVGNFGYEQPNVQAFLQRYGVDPHLVANDDPRWVALRCEPQTQFMRGVRKLMDQRENPVPITVMGHNQYGYRGVLPGMDGYDTYGPMGGNLIRGSKDGLFLDLPAWANEHLMDNAVLAGYYVQDGNAETAYAELKSELSGSAVKAWLYDWVPAKPEDMEKSIRRAIDLGANEILFWEADYIDNMSAEAFKAMCDYTGKQRGRAVIQ